MDVRAVASRPSGARGCSLRAISTLVCPSAISRSTSTSRGESASSVSERCSASRRAAIRGLTNSSPCAAARTACGSSSSASSLATNPSAPAANARCANTGSSSIVITTIFVSGARSRSRLIASMLDPPGMFRSSTSTCGSMTHDVPGHARDVVRFGDHFDAVLAVEQQSAGCGASARGRLPAPPGSGCSVATARASAGCGRAVDVRPCEHASPPQCCLTTG